MKLYVLLLFLPLTLFAKHHFDSQTVALAKKLNLYGGEKAVIQWERVFSSTRHLKRYKLDTLDAATREKLKAYLIEHAADSDQPIVPGL